MTENMNNGLRFRAWSLSRQKYLVLTEDGGEKTPKIRATGDDEGKESQFTMVLNTANLTFNENSAHLVFTAQDGQNYALIADLKDGTVSFTKYEKSSEHIGAFVKESLGEQGPTYALRVAQSQSCIAANKDGFLSLRPFERIYPHPDTIFVLSKV
ncbi:uncharacterized protein [Pocillopora verrucosa]|uniref:uncharacterized protein n=1 Tax=Pocillopora verrucosa TaxID=203993 RepID=UPI00333F5F57